MTTTTREEQKYVFIHELSEAEYIELYRVVSDPATAQWLGDGRPWTPEKLLAARNYSATDFARPWAARDYFYWAIVVRDVSSQSALLTHVVGIVGLHPCLPQVDKNALQIMFAVAPSERGKGRATKAIRAVMGLWKARMEGIGGASSGTNVPRTSESRPIYAIVRADNAPSLRTVAHSEQFGEPEALVIRGVEYAVHKQRL
jgi:RimJ/RimL family protein N-acetyltransferase